MQFQLNLFLRNPAGQGQLSGSVVNRHGDGWHTSDYLLKTCPDWHGQSAWSTDELEVVPLTLVQSKVSYDIAMRVSVRRNQEYQYWYN